MNQETTSNNMRIAKNTLLLYGRMIMLMVISLYTSRIVLNALGVEDYGIYNVVGGIVGIFELLTSSLSAAISRFITYELGKKDNNRLHEVFCTSINVQFILIIIVVILFETAGLWYLNNVMVIPAERLNAARWVYQLSVITFAINLWSVPYNASIVAHERMSAFAYISLYEGFAKLIIAFLILRNPIDRLVFYSALLVLVSVTVRILYSIYCKKHFSECNYSFIINKSLLRQIFSFAGWNFIGAGSVVLREQGGTLLINFFCGPAVNAARGVAGAVNNAVNGFVNNFTKALNPQITKNYAQGNFDYMTSLAFRGARFSFYILWLFALPIILTAPYLLHLWLGVVPEYTVSFTRLILVFSLSESLAMPLITIMLATGNIRNYQIAVGGCMLLNVPLSYLLLYLGGPPESVYYVYILTSVLCELLRLIMLRKMVGLPVRSFLKEVYFNVMYVSIISFILPAIISYFWKIDNLFSFACISLISVCSAGLIIYFVGCNAKDRAFVKSMSSAVVSKFKFRRKDK